MLHVHHDMPIFSVQVFQEFPICKKKMRYSTIIHAWTPIESWSAGPHHEKQKQIVLMRPPIFQRVKQLPFRRTRPCIEAQATTSKIFFNIQEAFIRKSCFWRSMFCGVDLSYLGLTLQFSFLQYRETVAPSPKTRTKNTNTLCQNNVQCLGTFAKLRKATISSVISVCPLCQSVRLSVRLLAWNNCVPTGRIFIKFDIRAFF